MIYREAPRQASPGSAWLLSLTRGFTLIELTISAALMSLIIVSAYLCLHAALASQKLIEPRLDALQSARVALALMTADLRCACPLSQDYEFVGTHRTSGGSPVDSVDFATHNYTPRRAREGDYCQVSFFLDKDPRTGQLGLWRRRNPRIAVDPFSGGTRELLAKDVAGLLLEYSDGLDWYDSWGDPDRKKKEQFSLRVRSNLSGLPEAVRVTLLLNADAHQKRAEDQENVTNAPLLMFRTVARLNLADAGQAGPSSGSTSNAPAGGNPAEQPPQQANPP
ncbi:MAG TPA: prepilin-type N-terminal cleavage/methylation domain-containing protein [Verrucomicrobiae bacterium]|nr:prepilin-type N-terminal cleavage/methylation domain-containing protein [Verrucomicrobiae bacterium]